MSIESETREFTRTGKAWSILLLAFISWVVISLWSFKVSGYSLASLVAEPDEDSASYDIANNADSTTPILAQEITGDSSNMDKTVTESGNEVGDLSEAEREQARIKAEEAAALAEQQAAEELRLEQEAEVEAQRLAAQVDAAREQARIEAEEAALAEQQAAEELRLEQEAEAEAQRLAAQVEAEREQARIDAEEAAALAEQQAAEELRLEQEAEIEAQRLAAQADAAREKARIDAEEAAALARQQAAGELRLEQEAEAEAEETRLLAIAEEASVQAEEQASREQEQRALELQTEAEAEAEAEAEMAEQTRLALLEQSKDESDVLDVSAELSASAAQPASSDTGQNVSDIPSAALSEAPDLFEGEVVVLEPQALPRTSIEVAAVETETVRQSASSRVRQRAAAQRRASFLRLREQELKVLSGQSARIRFDPESSVITRDLERPLDRIFEPLFLYAETPVVITVSGNEYVGEMLDGELSLSRGSAIVEYLVSRGLDQERFTVQIESGEDLQLDTHRVRISAEEAVQ
ncbi:MAG: hypothetical protein AB8B63_08910 [Granulosicoccus sp.]